MKVDTKKKMMMGRGLGGSKKQPKKGNVINLQPLTLQNEKDRVWQKKHNKKVKCLHNSFLPSLCLCYKTFPQNLSYSTQKKTEQLLYNLILSLHLSLYPSTVVHTKQSFYVLFDYKTMSAYMQTLSFISSNPILMFLETFYK